ncbi:MAG: hypothetical protein V4505_15450 [Pseudomonadota bacterium]
MTILSPTATDLPGAVPHGVPPVYTDTLAASVQQAPAASAVSWGAIFAGAAGAAALSLILLLLGTGLGLSSASPWASQGASAGALGLAGIAWITFTQLAASGMGGYLAGRLRTRWVAVHTDEVYFRDTAHGFLAWGVATLVTAAFLTSAVGSILGTGAKAGAAVAGGAVSMAGAAGAGATAMAARSGAGSGNESTGYFVDALFRPDMSASASAPATPAPSADAGTAPGSAMAAAPMAGMPSMSGSTGSTSTGNAPSSAATSAEVSRILANGLRTGSLSSDDQRYVARLVAQRTGISQQDAEKRVADTFAKAQAKLNDAENAAKEAADQARASAAHGALWLFISLLVGAFVASLAATFGGRQRDL